MSGNRIVIRFDGPPGPEAGRFVEVERNGASINYGEWQQDGDDWLLVLPDDTALIARLRERNERLEKLAEAVKEVEHRETLPNNYSYAEIAESCRKMSAALAAVQGGAP